MKRFPEPVHARVPSFSPVVLTMASAGELGTSAKRIKQAAQAAEEMFYLEPDYEKPLTNRARRQARKRFKKLKHG